MRHLQHATAAAYGDDTRYEHHFKEAGEELTMTVKMLFPWIVWAQESKVDDYQKAWEEFFGIKVGSPEWVALEKRGKLIGEINKQKRKT